jgi:hypothetical protein
MHSGHWYGEKREFNYLTVYNITKPMNYVIEKYPAYDDQLECIKSMALTTGHAELTAQAYYLGTLLFILIVLHVK